MEQRETEAVGLQLH